MMGAAAGGVGPMGAAAGASLLESVATRSFCMQADLFTPRCSCSSKAAAARIFLSLLSASSDISGRSNSLAHPSCRQQQRRACEQAAGNLCLPRVPRPCSRDG